MPRKVPSRLTFPKYYANGGRKYPSRSRSNTLRIESTNIQPTIEEKGALSNKNEIKPKGKLLINDISVKEKDPKKYTERVKVYKLPSDNSQGAPSIQKLFIINSAPGTTNNDNTDILVYHTAIQKVVYLSAGVDFDRTKFIPLEPATEEDLPKEVPPLSVIAAQNGCSPGTHDKHEAELANPSQQAHLVGKSEQTLNTPNAQNGCLSGTQDIHEAEHVANPSQEICLVGKSEPMSITLNLLFTDQNNPCSQGLGDSLSNRNTSTADIVTSVKDDIDISYDFEPLLKKIKLEEIEAVTDSYSSIDETGLKSEDKLQIEAFVHDVSMNNPMQFVKSENPEIHFEDNPLHHNINLPSCDSRDLLITNQNNPCSQSLGDSLSNGSTSTADIVASDKGDDIDISYDFKPPLKQIKLEEMEAVTDSYSSINVEETGLKSEDKSQIEALVHDACMNNPIQFLKFDNMETEDNPLDHNINQDSYSSIDVEETRFKSDNKSQIETLIHDVSMNPSQPTFSDGTLMAQWNFPGHTVDGLAYSSQSSPIMDLKFLWNISTFKMSEGPGKKPKKKPHYKYPSHARKRSARSRAARLVKKRQTLEATMRFMAN